MLPKNHATGGRANNKTRGSASLAPPKARLVAFKDMAAALAGPALAALGLELVLAQCLFEDGRPVLRLFIDRLPGEAEVDSIGSSVSLDDCAAASRAVGALLEEGQSEHPDGYVLEVSSPGLNRALVREADFRRFNGRLAKIKLRLEDKTATYKGRLSAGADGSLALETAEVMLPFAFDQVLSARLALDDIQGGK